MAKKKIKFNELVQEVVENARDDRKKADGLLKNLEEDIKNKVINNNEHGFIGTTVAKYMEIRSRANEQLVKLTSIIHKNSEDDSEEIKDKEKEQIFESIEEKIN